MKRKKLITLLIGMCLILVLVALPFMSACGPAEPGEMEEEEEEEEEEEVKYIKIGHMGSWTGAFASAGKPVHDSFFNAVDIFNEKGGIIIDGQRYLIEPIEYDCRSDSKRGASGINYLIDMHDIKMIVGPCMSSVTLAAQPVWEAAKVFDITWSSAVETTRPGVEWTFRMAARADRRMQSVTQTVAHILKAKTVSIITENAAYTLSLRDQALLQFEEFGVEVVSDDIYEPTVKDYSTVIARARKPDPDIFFTLCQHGNIELMVKQVYEAGWPVMMAGPGELGSDEVFRVAGAGADELVVAGGGGIDYWVLVGGQVPQETLDEIGVNLAEVEKVADKFKANYDPQGIALLQHGYKGLAAYVALIERTGEFIDTEKMRETFVGMEYETPFMTVKALRNQHFSTYVTCAIYYPSEVGGDNYDLLSYITHTDDMQEDWITVQLKDYDSFPAIRQRRGY